ncbi:XRE family transcriptional regulator [Pseudomonas sp. BCA14]|uniref:helix-turn-helix domain-containing protein n=1 Tax=unclassified Pseudomonas TaxID=196821 RepID=UPI00106E364E|nr:MULTISPECIES: helix-turn-helix transcriptional regulator [unclassified Pseudomonas]TFF09693.1 XRE family transcriptional regulator [Pseudomonas sp. JMN1]TFF11835.1 XRE family transcriptional regulator [Pseudomonas sp. BCA17]TFF28611.1 XRE family transcriptional regulator [Pseudomonas sp. BCA14]
MTITEMLGYLTEQGWSQERIAKQCGTTQPTIFRITKGSTVSYEVGTAIVALHKKVAKAKRKAA